ncbi:MAG: hypothetical protein HQ567_03240 [Candidatus Nealsonbacteria bacterium]|nr:hypothetical protein [Candidatus Nealsonbacteria bacterium]
MQEHIRPDLAHSAAQMGINQAKVSQYVDTLAAQVDELVDAAAREDWNQVRQISQQVASSGREYGQDEISAMAEQLGDEATHHDDVLGMKRRMIRLIGTYGRSDRARETAK